MPDEAKPPVDYAAERQKERDEYLDLASWWTDTTDEAILSAAQDFTSSAKASAYARQIAKKSDPDKFRRLTELELKTWRWLS